MKPSLEQLNAMRDRIEREHARRMAWCADNPTEAGERYGLDVMERSNDRPFFGDRPPLFHARHPMRTWAHAIARELCGEEWGYQILELDGGGVRFIVTLWRNPSVDPLTP